MLFFHYLACLCTSWVLFQSLIRLTSAGPIFHLGSLTGLCSEARRLVPLWPSSSPVRLRFLGLVSLHIFPALCFLGLIPAWHMDLAQPAAASIKGQRTLDHWCKFLQKVFRENLFWKSPSEWKVSFGIHLIDLLNLKEHWSWYRFFRNPVFTETRYLLLHQLSANVFLLIQ